MRTRPLVALIAVALAIVAFGVYAVTIAPGPVVASPSPTPGGTGGTGGTEGARGPAPSRTPRTLVLSPVPEDDPGQTAADYFAAWRTGDLTAMAALVADPPADFAERHRRFDAELRVASLSLAPGEPRRPGEDAAEVPFTGEREVAGLGRWPFAAVLRLSRSAGGWKVRWSPETLHPALAGGGGVRLRETQVRRPATLTQEGRPFPRDSRAGDYYTGLGGTAVELALEETPSGRVLLASPSPPAAGTRSTISQTVQAAAARALDGFAAPAAIVALDADSGQLRAVADTLGGKRAFIGLYPPGSTFKVVTASALLRAGLTADSPVPCPAAYTVPNGKPFTDADGTDHGVIPFTRAFALSCNTTFVQQTHERLPGDRLRTEAADRFGFREKPGLSYCRIRPYGNADELASDAIGQNSVEASPLCMAEVAAAVASGVWKPAIMTAEASDGSPDPVPLDEGVAAALRTMMRSVVTDGTAARAGLPPDTAGKTGTAEVEGAQDHAWFIGYRDGLAFAVFVQNGGSGGTVAAPLAARFLAAL
ncbi:penicillin-binding transpeptidase domain-containing protein [Streptosporangium soli]|nr:cell division protein FtsI [Streptosporangium sp. KLBMP 9127]